MNIRNSTKQNLCPQAGSNFPRMANPVNAGTTIIYAAQWLRRRQNGYPVAIPLTHRVAPPLGLFLKTINYRVSASCCGDMASVTSPGSPPSSELHRALLCDVVLNRRSPGLREVVEVGAAF